MAKSIGKATKEERKKWVAKSKKTRASHKKEQDKLYIDLQVRDTDDLLVSVEKLNYYIRAMKFDKLSEKEKKNTLNILSILENM